MKKSLGFNKNYSKLEEEYLSLEHELGADEEHKLKWLKEGNIEGTQNKFFDLEENKDIYAKIYIAMDLGASRLVKLRIESVKIYEEYFDKELEIKFFDKYFYCLDENGRTKEYAIFYCKAREKIEELLEEWRREWEEEGKKGQRSYERYKDLEVSNDIIFDGRMLIRNIVKK